MTVDLERGGTWESQRCGKMGLGTRVRTQKEIKPETEESQLFNRHRDKTWKYCEKRPAARVEQGETGSG